MMTSDPCLSSASRSSRSLVSENPANSLLDDEKFFAEHHWLASYPFLKMGSLAEPQLTK
jgi:hypothetical protein